MYFCWLFSEGDKQIYYITLYVDLISSTSSASLTDVQPILTQLVHVCFIDQKSVIPMNYLTTTLLIGGKL